MHSVLFPFPQVDTGTQVMQWARRQESNKAFSNYDQGNKPKYAQQEGGSSTPLTSSQKPGFFKTICVVFCLVLIGSTDTFFFSSYLWYFQAGPSPKISTAEKS